MQSFTVHGGSFRRSSLLITSNLSRWIGSNEADLVRAQIDSAIGIFIMTNKNSANPDKKMQKLSLNISVLTILCRIQGGYHVCTIVAPENRPHLRNQKQRRVKIWSFV